MATLCSACSKCGSSGNRSKQSRCKIRLTCQGCGGSFTPKASDRMKYCSRNCAFANIDQWHAKKNQNSVESKVKQEVEALRSLGKPKRMLSIRKEAMARAISRRMRSCPDCGNQWLGPKYGEAKVVRCESCSSKRKAEYRRSYKRKRKAEIGNHRKRARHFNVAYDPTVQATEVFRRDGWKCQGCGCKIKRTIAYHPKRATIDHIIPMAKGGGHTWDNVQAMCATCNGVKSDNAIGCQMRLI